MTPPRYYPDGGLVVDPDDLPARERFIGLLRPWGFSPREAECFWHLLRGVTAGKDLARTMGVGHQQVKNYLQAAIGWSRTTNPAAAQVAAAVTQAWRAYRWACDTEEGSETCP